MQGGKDNTYAEETRVVSLLRAREHVGVVAVRRGERQHTVQPVDAQAVLDAPRQRQRGLRAHNKAQWRSGQFFFCSAMPGACERKIERMVVCAF